MAILEALEMLLHCKGFVTSFLIKDIVLIVLGVFLLKNIIIPKINAYRLGKKLDSIAKGPKAHWFYGHLFTFGKSFADSLIPRSRVSSSYPVMFNEWKAPWFSVLTLHHPDASKAFFNSGAPKDKFIYGAFRPWLGDALALTHGKKWQRNRLLLTPTFHLSMLKQYNEVFNKGFRALIKRWEKMADQPIEVHDEINVLTLNIIVHCAMSSGDDFENTNSKENEIYRKEFKNILSRIAQRFDNPLYTIDWIFNNSAVGRSFYNSIKALNVYTNKMIAERRKEIKLLESASSIDEKQHQFLHRHGKRLDFLDILLQTRDEDGKGLSENQIHNEVDSMLFGGHDTTASVLSWSLYHLAKYPKLQKKCREEVNEIIGKKENIEWDDLNKFRYLIMFINENLRFYPPVLFLGRELKSPLTIESKLHKPEKVVIPEGTSLCLNVMALHRNEHTWENPEEFDPERFSPENCAKRHPYAFVPFAAGSRNCIGKAFGMNEIIGGLAQIIRRFELYLDDSLPSPILECRMILKSSNGLFVKLKKIEP